MTKYVILVSFIIGLIIAKVVMATLVFVYTDQLVATVKIESSLLFRGNMPEFHDVEKTLSCCGPDGPASYGFSGSTSLQLPPSCCEAEGKACTYVDAFADGCNYRIENFIRTFSTAIGAVCIIFAALELVAVVFGLCKESQTLKRTTVG